MFEQWLVLRLFKKFPVSYWIRRFIALITKSFVFILIQLQASLSFTDYYPNIILNIIFPPTHWSPKLSLLIYLLKQCAPFPPNLVLNTANCLVIQGFSVQNPNFCNYLSSSCFQLYLPVFKSLYFPTFYLHAVLFCRHFTTHGCFVLTPLRPAQASTHLSKCPCELYRFPFLFHLLRSCFFVVGFFFPCLISSLLHLSYHSLLHISMRNEAEGGGMCVSRRIPKTFLRGRGVKSLPKRPDLPRLEAGLGLPWLWLR